MLHVSQVEIELFLENKLAHMGIKVQREKKVTKMTPSGEGKGINVIFEDGGSLQATYVIGADGSRSVVSATLTPGDQLNVSKVILILKLYFLGSKYSRYRL